MAETKTNKLVRLETGTDEVWPELYGTTEDGQVFQTFLLDHSPETFEAAVKLLEGKAAGNVPCFATLSEFQIEQMNGF